MVAAFSPSGRLVAAADWQGAVYLVDLLERKTTGIIASGDVRPTGLAFSPDGKFLATGSGNQAIQLWDVATRQLVRKLRGHHGKVSGLAFTPDGRTLVSGAMDGTVRLWNPFGQADGSRITNMLAAFGMNPPKFSPDGKWLSLLTEKTTETRTSRLLDTARLQLSASIAGELVSFSPESEQFATLLNVSGSALQVWTMGGSSNRAEFQLELSAAERVFSPQLSPDGTILALQASAGPRNSGMELFQAATGKRLLSLPYVSWVGTASCFLPKGRTWAYANGSSIQFWDMQSRSNTFSLQCDGDLLFFSISPDEKTLAASLSDHRISVWDMDSRSKVGTLVGHQALVFSLAFSPDGRTLASGSEDRTIRLWHLATHRELASFTQERAVYWLAFSPDNQLLVSGGLGAYQLWRAPRGDAAVTSGASSPAPANLPTNSIWRLSVGADRSPPRMAAEQNVCFTNLLKIHAAIMAYRKDHRQMPDGLGDLVPAYLSDTNSLICPVQARTGKMPDLFGMEELKVASSYFYTFNVRTNIFPDPFGVAAPGDTMRAWKEKQLARYGPVVPVVRCWMHPKVLSVTWAGESRTEPEPAWEAAAERTLREKPAAGTNATPIPR